MTERRTRLAGALALLCLFLVSATLRAQEEPTESAPPSEGRKPGTYVKVGLAHWQGDIFSESSLTRWSGDLFGADYALTSAGVEIDTYLPWGWFPVSGFAIAYRKDTLSSREAGHMLSGTLFHDFDLKLLAVKVGGGVEWGIPALNFDQTEYEHLADGTVRYRHTYPGWNAEIPVGARPNGITYPFVALSLLQRPGPLLLEVGMRVNFVRFHFDDYEVRPGGETIRAFAERQVRVPYLFANVGLRLF